MIAQPDVLVLGAGGALAERWMDGLLAGLVDGAGMRLEAIEQLVGTSAGAIVAAGLLAGREPARPDPPGAAMAAAGGADDADRDADETKRGRARRVLGALPAGAGKVARAAGAPLAPYALAATRPPGALVRAGVLGRLETPTATLDELGARIARDGLRFDGRLRIVCVERESGRRVVFGAPGAPQATVAEAVQASCSVPWLYRPVRIGEHEYVDGGLWSPTSIDIAPVGRRRACWRSTRPARPAATPPRTASCARPHARRRRWRR